MEATVAHDVMEAEVEAAARAYAEAAGWSWECTLPEFCDGCDCVIGWTESESVEDAQAHLCGRMRAALTAAAAVRMGLK